MTGNRWARVLVWRAGAGAVAGTELKGSNDKELSEGYQTDLHASKIRYFGE